MTASDWRERKRSKRLGVIEQNALIADLEATEKEFADYKVDCCATHEADNEKCMKAEADRAALAAALRKAYEPGVRERVAHVLEEVDMTESPVNYGDWADRILALSHPALPADVAEHAELGELGLRVAVQAIHDRKFLAPLEHDEGWKQGVMVGVAMVKASLRKALAVQDKDFIRPTPFLPADVAELLARCEGSDV